MVAEGGVISEAFSHSCLEFDGGSQLGPKHGLCVLDFLRACWLGSNSEFLRSQAEALLSFMT